MNETVAFGRAGGPRGPRASLAERLERLSVPEPNSGCLLWIGAYQVKKGEKRPVIRIGGKLVCASRVAFFVLHGRWPDPCALHRCDTPMCIEENHLFEGTVADNARDMASKGRHRCQKTTRCPKGHAYDTTNTRVDSRGKRSCRACDRARGGGWARSLSLR